MDLELVNEVEKQNIDYIKSYLRSYAKASRIAKTVTFDEGVDANSPDYIMDCILRCDNFYVTVRYTANYKNLLEVVFVFSGCSYAFKTYDVLNLLEINDFSIYEFGNCDTESRIKNALDRITYFIDTYGYDLNRIQPDRKLNRLVALYEKDRKTLYGEFWKTNEEYLESDSYRIVSGTYDTKKNKSRLIKKLEGMDELTTYDERRLDYLKNNVDVIAEDGGGDPSPAFKSLRLKVYAPIWVCSFFLMLFVYFYTKNIIFDDAFIISSLDEKMVGGLTEYLQTFAGLWISIALIFIKTIGHILILALIPSYAKPYAREKLKGTMPFIIRIAIPIIAIGVAVICLIAPLSTIGFDEDKVIEYHLFDYNEYDYSEIKVYHATGERASNGFVREIEDGEAYYYVGFDDHYSLDIPMIYENDADDKKLKEILNKHNVEIIDIKYVEKLDEIYDIKD